jgi:hypothetical protein
METKKTYQELNQLISSINLTLGNQETKVQKKLFKVYEKVKKHHEDYQSQREELRLDAAAVDDKGIVLTDEKGEYKFSKDGIKQLTKDIDALNKKEFDFKLIEVINTNGLENLTFLENWTTGITFVKEEEEEL